MYLIMYLLMYLIIRPAEARHLRMDRQLRQKVRPAAVRRKPRRRGHLAPAVVLDDLLAEDVVLQIAEGIANLVVERPVKGLLDQFPAARTLRKDHHVDLGAGKESLRFLVEEQDADIPRLHKLVGPFD